VGTASCQTVVYGRSTAVPYIWVITAQECHGSNAFTVHGCDSLQHRHLKDSSQLIGVVTRLATLPLLPPEYTQSVTLEACHLQHACLD
jgi:hypothetical protein